MIRSRSIARAAVFASATLWPAAAQACAVCFSGSGRVRSAFFDTTILLSLLPLAMIFGGLWYLWRSGKVRWTEEFTGSDYSLTEAAVPAVVVERAADPAAPSPHRA